MYSNVLINGFFPISLEYSFLIEILNFKMKNWIYFIQGKHVGVFLIE